MNTETNYNFNRTQQKNWFPYSYSKNPNDFIILNGVHGRCPTVKCSEDCQQSNIDYWKNFTVEHVVDGDIDIGCFGCSFTYGSHLKYEDTWPALLQKTLGMKTANFGVPGGGVDACFINLKNCFEKYKIKTAVILLPQFDRKLCTFEKQGNYFQMPVAPNTEWHYGDNVASNFFDSAFILQQIKRTKKHIVEDIDNKHSIGKLKQLISFCKDNKIQLYLSSWCNEVYNHMKDLSVNLLPFYDLHVVEQRAQDGEHPCVQHNQIWVDDIKSKIL